ncbi:hypothetical protein ACHAWF_013179 [Thalassiosira exigua]
MLVKSGILALALSCGCVYSNDSFAHRRLQSEDSGANDNKMTATKAGPGSTAGKSGKKSSACSVTPTPVPAPMPTMPTVPNDNSHLSYENCDVCDLGKGGAPCVKLSTSPACRSADRGPSCIAADGQCYRTPFKKSAFTNCINFNGLDRCWIQHVPKNFCKTRPAKLVIDIHGRFGSAEGWRNFSGWLKKSEEEGFMAVWPQGTQIPYGQDLATSFNGGATSTMNVNFQLVNELELRGCCDPALTAGIDDVGFLRAMVDVITKEYGIDKRRHVYWTGVSNGCTLSQRMAAEANDIVAAVACTSHYLMKDSTEFISRFQDQYMKKPVPILEIHGSADPIVWYGNVCGQWGSNWPGLITDEAGQWTGEYPFYKGTGITGPANREKWASFNKCSDYLSRLAGGEASLCSVPESGEIKSYVIESSRMCRDGAEVANLVIIGAGHVPYPSSVNEVGIPDVVSLMWDFMKRFPDNKNATWIPTECENVSPLPC